MCAAAAIPIDTVRTLTNFSSAKLVRVHVP
eukprot:SAG31_NODE_41333_length_276_cov_1.169492_1_plen_29_part_10